MKMWCCLVLLLSVGIARASEDDEICGRMRYPAVPAPESRIYQIASRLMTQARIKNPIMVCMLDYHQTIFPVMGTRPLHDGRIVFVVSEEFECDLSDLALRGLVAHEVAHYLISDHDEGLGEPLTDDQKNQRESAVDRRAVGLVGKAALRAALEESRRVSDSSVHFWLNHFHHEMDERLRLLEERDS